MSLYDAFVDRVEQEPLFSKDDRLLLAVSGGVDSVVLCDLLHRAGYLFAIAHCNFRLRGAESDADEEFVRSLATAYERRVFVRHFDTEAYAVQQKVSIQEAARNLRYQWFDALMDEEVPAYRWLLTAHHADDNAETIVMHFFRGTGIAGLRGMLQKQGRLVRPLLPFTKKELVQYARMSGLDWREDSSNITEKYTRNFFRLEVLPLVEKRYPEALANILGNAGRFREVEEVYLQAMARYRQQLLKPSGGEFHISVGKLRQVSPVHTILYELTRPFGFHSAQVPEILRLLESGTGKFVASESHRIIRNRNWLVIAPAQVPGVSHYVIGGFPHSIHTGDIDLEFDIEESGKGPVPEKEGCMHISADALVFPLLLRRWRPGDYFYPLGMKKKKKVARFLIDQKTSKTQKEKTWVLVSGDRIVCVVGMRIDDRFRVVAGTKRLLCIGHRPFERR